MAQSKLENIKSFIIEIIHLFQSGSTEEALIKSENLIKKEKEVPFLLNLNGIININLSNWDKAKISLKKAIDLDQNYVEAYNNLGIVYNNLGEIEKAIENFSLSIKIKNDYANGYNNLGSAYDDLGKSENAIKNYSKALEFDPKHAEAQKNLIHILTYYTPVNKNYNSIIVVNENLRKIGNNFHLKMNENKFDLATLFKSSNKVIQDNFKELTFFETQIYRRNTIDLNCNRHHKVFNKFNIIPKFCFSCFKIQIEPKNVLDLFKLFLIFDSLKLQNNNTRKCLIELRPNISGTYKGLIYCSSMEEVNKILKDITPILKKVIDNNLRIIAKRGCSEFTDKHKDYKETNKEATNFMKYNNLWEEKEKIIDINEAKNKKRKKDFKNSISGLSLSDVLIMNNWLNYAKEIDDSTYKNISEDMFYSDYISKTISPQLEKRKNEFLKP
jgi:tetratricopeptide (TPR) repeat protein